MSFNELQNFRQHSSSYPQRSSGRSLAQLDRVDIAHSYSHWNSRYTGKCGWKISVAISLCHHARHKGTEVHGAGCPRQWTHTALFQCWSHTGPPLPLWERGSTGRSAAPRGWHTPGETGPALGWHTGPSTGNPLSTCWAQRGRKREFSELVWKNKVKKLKRTDRIYTLRASISFFFKPLYHLRGCTGCSLSIR